MELRDTQQKKVRAQRLPGQDREFFMENFQLMMSAGIPVNEALLSIKQVSTGARLKKAVSRTQRYIEDGMPLWRALSITGLASDQTSALILVGEQSGNLAKKLRAATRIENNQQQQRSQIKSALTYPVFVMGLTVFVGLGIAWFLLPRLTKTFDQLDLELPLITRVMLQAGQFMQQYGKIAVPVAIVIIILFNYILFFAPITKQFGLRLLLRLPGVGTLIKETEVAKMGHLLSSLLEAGMPITKSLDIMAGATENPRFRKLYKSMKAGMEEGFTLSTCLNEKKNYARVLPPTVRQLIIVAERSGTIVQTLERIAQIYDQKAIATTKKVEVMTEPIMLIIVWVGVMLLALGVFLPVYQLIGGLNT